MIPYSPEVFFSFLAQYNAAIWPAQPIAFLLGIAVTVLATARGRVAVGYAGRPIAAVLALSWVWTGAVYHLSFFAEISFWDLALGVLFILQGIVLFWSGVLRDRLQAAPAGDTRDQWIVPIFALLALIAHPLLSTILGHGWSEIAWFGVSPTATLIMTLGMLLRLPPGPAVIYFLVVPLLLCLTGILQAYLLPLPQDWLLAPAALGTLLIIWTRKPWPENPARDNRP